MSQHRRSVIRPALAVCLVGIGCLACRAADTDEIVERAGAALKSDWAADPSYACVEKDEVERHDRVTSKSFEVVMIDGSDYRLPIAVDDEPLPAERRKAELVKFKNEIERREHESPSARQTRIEAWKRQRDQNGELLLDFPGFLTFHLLGQEMENGRDAYVFSATPRPGVVATTRAGKVLTGVEGKAWVEKENMHPIRVRCTVIRPVPIYGFLASVLPGTDIDIGMTNVAGSTWLIDSVSMKLKVSKLSMFKSTEVTRYTYTRYCPNDQAVEKLLAEAERE